MHLAWEIQDLLEMNPDMGLVEALTVDAEGMQRFREEKHLLFERAGQSTSSSYITEAQ